jgi:predicted alpha/beta superfamily hydrolase
MRARAVPRRFASPMFDRRRFTASCLATLSARSFATAPALAAQTGPVALPGTFVHPLPDPASGRRYEAWVDVPSTSDAGAGPRPAVFVTDAPYAFPLVRSLRNRVGQGGRNLAEFVLVGLAPPADESSGDMRNRDYTPTDPLARPWRPGESYGGKRYGGGADYVRYLADIAVPAVSAHYGLDPARRVILGHSYGALLAAQLLFERTTLFSHYVLGSPSLWFDHDVMFEREAGYAKSHHDLPAKVFQYVGAFEAVGSGRRYNTDNDLVRDARRFDRTLARRGYPSLSIETHVLADEDHLTVAPRGATLGLLWALPGRGPYDGG